MTGAIIIGVAVGIINILVESMWKRRKICDVNNALYNTDREELKWKL